MSTFHGPQLFKPGKLNATKWSRANSAKSQDEVKQSSLRSRKDQAAATTDVHVETHPQVLFIDRNTKGSEAQQRSRSSLLGKGEPIALKCFGQSPSHVSYSRHHDYILQCVMLHPMGADKEAGHPSQLIIDDNVVEVWVWFTAVLILPSFSGIQSFQAQTYNRARLSIKQTFRKWQPAAREEQDVRAGVKTWLCIKHLSSSVPHRLFFLQLCSNF